MAETIDAAVEDVSREHRQEGQQRQSQECRQRREDRQRDDRRFPLRVAKAALQLVGHRRLSGGLHMLDRHRQQRDDHHQKRQPVETEAGSAAPRRKRRAREERPDDAREIELDRVERDGVWQVVLADERRDQRLIGRAAKRLPETRDEREQQNVRNADDVPVDQRGQCEGRRHLDELRSEKHVPPIVPVGDDAADQREEQNRQLPEEVVQSEVER